MIKKIFLLIDCLFYGQGAWKGYRFPYNDCFLIILGKDSLSYKSVIKILSYKSIIKKKKIQIQPLKQGSSAKSLLNIVNKKFGFRMLKPNSKFGEFGDAHFNKEEKS